MSAEASAGSATRITGTPEPIDYDATSSSAEGESAKQTPSFASSAGSAGSKWGSRRRWIAGGVALAVAAPGLWYLSTQPLAGSGAPVATGTGAPAKGVGPRADFEAPNFSLKDPAGKTIELKALRGKPVLLNFWATWCVPCRDEMPELEMLWRENKDKGLVVLAVSVDNARAARDIPEFLKAGDPRVGAYTFPVVLDENQDVLKQYKLLGVPQSFFIDPAGVIREVQPRVMNRQTMLDGVSLIVPERGGAR
jgi:peroxiredoxin